MIRILGILLFALLTPILSDGQTYSVPTAKAQRQMNQLRGLISNMEYAQAGLLAQKITKRYPQWAEVWMATAEIAHETGQPELCEKATERVVTLDSTGYPGAYRWLAVRKFSLGLYTEALELFYRYKSVRVSQGIENHEDSLLVASLLFSLKEVQKTSVSYPEKLPEIISSDEDDYFPSLTADGSKLVFTRIVRKRGGAENISTNEDLIQADWRNGSFLNVRVLPGPITTLNNEGTQTLRQDGRVMIYTACNRPDTKGGCDLYLSGKTGDSWSVPVNLGYPVNTRYWESTPCLSTDNRTLLFASNRPGGIGGMDIWMSTRLADGSWSQPQNLGRPVNSPGDEMSPQFGSNLSDLCFASNGHIGLGGFDLYISGKDNDGKLTQPVNLGFPINTHANEDGIAISGLQGIAIIASDRDQTTGKDLYLTKWEKRDDGLSSVIVIKGLVQDRKTGLPLAAKIEIQPSGDHRSSQVDSDPVSGSFLLGIPRVETYRLTAGLSGYMPYSEYVVTKDHEFKGTITKKLLMDAVSEGSAVVLHNIFFRVDSYELLPESEGDLVDLLGFILENPGLKFEISGHTDSTGTPSYNEALSQKRAESVRNYLINSGLSPATIVAKGYGSNQPITNNSTEKGRAANRRTELRVVTNR